MGRRRTRVELVGAEFNESLDHLRQAATHAVSGVETGMRVGRDYVAPRAAKAREAASDNLGSALSRLAPLAETAAGTARQAGTVARRKKAENMRGMRKRQAKASRRRLTLTRLVAAGVIAGAIGAIAARRRRNRQEWESYEPVGAMAIREDTTVAMAAPDSAAGGGIGGRAASAGQPGGRPSAGERTGSSAGAPGAMSDSARPGAPNTSTTTRGGSL